jgi:beta-glucosidase
MAKSWTRAVSIPEFEHSHDHKKLEFPEGFLWGAATSAHQVEGNNINSDWWEWEKKHQPEDKWSGLADDQYNLYEQDFEMIKALGHNTHRLGIEWARIEPEDGLFNQEAIDHYVDVLKSLKTKNISVMLTLHHFTNPLWISKKGGWENGKTVWYFERFVKKIVPIIGEYVDLWCTVNEPGVYTYMAFSGGVWPPQKKSTIASMKVMWNMAQAHKKAYKVIHSFKSKAMVGFAQHYATYNRFHKHSIRETIAEMVLEIGTNHPFYILTGGKTNDFIGLNYYQNRYITKPIDKKWPDLLPYEMIKKDVSDMGWEIYPPGMFEALVDYSDHKPIYITENGIASLNDDRRVRFLLSFLKEIHHAIEMGVPVKGYYYWSLLDNFEWHDGFGPRFGMVHVDYKTQERIPKPSAFVYKDIAQNNGIRHELLKLLGHGIKVEEVLKDIK